MHYFSQYLQPFIDHFGYPGLGLVIFLESMGFPLPAESLLLAAVLYCASSHHMSIHNITLTAIIAAILGDSSGYLLGLKLGSKSIGNLAKKMHIKPVNFVTLRYLFRRFGGSVVILGRFFSLMRIAVALIAGSLKMPWHTFLFFNVIGGVIWALFYTYGVYYGVLKAFSMSPYMLGAIIVVIIIAALIFINASRRYFQYWTVKALDEMTVAERETLGITAEDVAESRLGSDNNHHNNDDH